MLGELNVCVVDTVNSSTTKLLVFFVRLTLFYLVMPGPLEHHSHFICEDITKLNVAQSIFSSRLSSVQLCVIRVVWSPCTQPLYNTWRK